MRILIPVLSALALSACESPEAGSEAGVGFQSYSDYIYEQQMIGRREAEQRRAAAAQQAPATGAAGIAADTMTALRGPQGAASAAPTPRSGPGEPLSALSPQGATAAVAPSAAPAAADGTNIAAYALSTSHPVGQAVYRRNSAFRQAAFDKACANYPSDAMAQEAFLKAGGPERDRLGIDPDGDGYACRWDPAPFRLARQRR